VTRAADVIVIGAGVVGLACGAQLARAGRSVLVLERAAGIARETSSRNSQVIHAGLYYPPGSLKARLCVEGAERIYARCAREGIPHRALGKLVVATEPHELSAIEALRERGETNGARGLALVDAAEVARREPHVRALAALWSPRTGILDAHALCDSYAAELARHGGELLLRHEVIALAPRAGGWRVEARAPDGAREAAECDAVVNAAGLAADHVAALAGVALETAGYRQHPCKGDYFALAPGAPLRFAGLVYPAPHGAGLGVHVTLDLGGRVRFGPDAEYVARLEYAVDAAKRERFAAAARRYVPSLDEAWLTPDQAGIRPKLAGPGEAFRDFVIAEEGARGLPGLVNLVGIESPGLTASEAIGARVAGLLAGAA
jgi:L-2-hydroxyglutarate oxidase LhgO